MGNTDCCCTSRRNKIVSDEPLKEGECETVQHIIYTSLNPKAATTADYLSNSFRSFSLQKEENAVKPYSSLKNLAPLEANSKLSNDYQTFGEEAFNLEDEPAIQTMEMESPLNKETQGEDVKKSLYKSNNPDRIIKIPKIVKINQKIFVHISIESLTIVYKNLEDFGIIFNPYIAIKIESEIPCSIYPVGGDITNSDSNLDKSTNTSSISDNDNSALIQISSSRQNSIFSNGNKKEKILNFKFSDCFEIPAQFAYTKIVFMLKNECIPGQENSEKKNPNSFHQITLGEAKIPINIIYKNFKENSFEGNIEIKLRDVVPIGYLKTKIYASDKLEVARIQDQLAEKLKKVNYLDFEAEAERLKFSDKNQGQADNVFDLLSNQSLKNSMNSWSDDLVYYEDLNPIIFAKYFTEEIKVDPKEALILANRIPRSKADYKLDAKDTSYKIRLDQSEASIILNEIFKQNNHIALYQFMNYLVDLTVKDEFKEIEDILKSLNEEDKTLLINLPRAYYENIFMIKLYLIFLHNYVKHFKHNENSTIRIHKDLQDKAIIANLIEILNQIHKKFSNLGTVGTTPPEYMLEMRDCVIMCMNIAGEMITQPLHASSIITSEEKKEEYTIIYENCIQLISSRNSILRLLNFYIADSQIISFIFRNFRKIIQILTSDNSEMLDEKKFKSKNFSANLRKFLIHQHEGVFISTLKSILLRYHHFPEVHNNILFIIYKLTNNCNSALLYFTSEKLNMNLFTDSFESFRGRIRSSTFRNLNNVHLSILSNLCEVDPSSNSYPALMELITNDLKSFYSLSYDFKKRREEFLSKKFVFLEIHEIVTRIAAKLTKITNCSKILKNSFFFNDIVEYIYTIAYYEFIANKKVNLKNQSVHTDFSQDTNFDFITKIKENKNNFSEEEICRLVYSIIENTIIIFHNVIRSEDEELYHMLTIKFIEYELKNTSLLNLMLERCMTLLENHGMDVTKLGELIENFNGHFEINENYE